MARERPAPDPLDSAGGILHRAPPGRVVGDRVEVTIPALDRDILVEVRSIATRGEYSGWRATRATGDFDLRTFEVRAYPVEPVPELRPGMSAYVDVGRRS